MSFSITVGLIFVAFFSSVFAWALVSTIRKYRRLAKKTKELEEKVFGRDEDGLLPAVKDDPSSYILDHPTHGQICDMIASAVMDIKPSFVFEPLLAHAELFIEFENRNMGSFAISEQQFLQEWREGVEQSLFFEHADGGEGIAYGCPLSKFTEIVELMIRTARRDPPSALCFITDHLGNNYSVTLGRGQVKYIYRSADEDSAA